jgi:ubiquitin conjugation factor E4 B
MLDRVESLTGSPLKNHLLLDEEDDQGIDLDFLSEAVKRFEEEDTLKPAFIVVVEEMSRDLSTRTVNDDYKPYVIVRVNFKCPTSLRIVS